PSAAGPPATPPADTMDFAAGGFGAPSPGGFRETTDGPVFELGGSEDEQAAPRPRQVFDLGEAGAAPEPPANPFADTQFANPFDLGGDTHPVPAAVATGGDETGRQIADAITPVLGELVTELRRSLDY